MADDIHSVSEPIADSTTHSLEVHFDPVDVQLIVEEPTLTVRPGDRIWWIFRGVPAGWSPWIDVDELANPPQLEGFIQSPWGVRATVASTVGGQGTIGYRATLQRGLGLHHPLGGALVRSAVAHLVAQTRTVPRLHTVRATYLPSGNAGTGSLTVEPAWVKISPGDVVVWKFAAKPTDIAAGSWHPRVDFVQFDGPEEPPNLHLGPFVTLVYGDDRVTASGDSRAPGVYNYVCLMIGRFDGRVISVSSPDPAIDRRGDPSGG